MSESKSNYDPSPEVLAAIEAIEAVPFTDKKGVGHVVKAAIAHRARCKIMREADADVEIPEAPAASEAAPLTGITEAPEVTGVIETLEADEEND